MSPPWYRSSRRRSPRSRTIPPLSSQTVLEAVGLSRSFGPIEVLERRVDRRARRRGPRDHRRERRRQVDADEDPQRPSRADPRRRSSSTARRSSSRARSTPSGAASCWFTRRSCSRRTCRSPRTCFSGAKLRRGLDGRRPGDEPARGRGDARVRRRGAGDRAGRSGCRSRSASWRRSPGRSPFRIASPSSTSRPRR